MSLEVADILKDVQSAISAEDPWQQKMLLQRIEIACEALKGQAREPDKGPWEVHPNGRSLMSDDFEHDVWLMIGGDFYSDGNRLAYAKALASRLNGAQPLPTGLPEKPVSGLLYSMALRYRHDFGLDKDPEGGPLQCGVTPQEREAILRTMAQLYEEVAGHGFFKYPPTS